MRLATLTQVALVRRIQRQAPPTRVGSRDVPIASTQPSVDDLLGRLQDDHAKLSALRAGVVHGVPRPAFIVQLLLLASVLLIAAFTVGIALLGLLSVRLTAQIRDHRAAEVAAAHALPSGEALRDPQVLAAALRQQPAAAARIHAARGAALLAAGDPRGALAAFAEARERSVVPPSPALQLAEIQALIAVGQIAQARTRLLACDLAPWPATERAAAVALLPKLLEAVAHQ